MGLAREGSSSLLKLAGAGFAAGLLAAGDLSAGFSRRVEDIRLGPTGSIGSLPHPIVLAGDLVYLPADDGSNGCELWKIDLEGLDAQLVENISGAGSGLGCGLPLLAVGDLVVFQANDGFIGNELWVSDGTQPGTQFLEDQTGGGGGTSFGGPPFFELDPDAAVVLAAAALHYVDGSTATGLTAIAGASNVSSLLGSFHQGVLYRTGSGQLWQARAGSASLLVDPDPGSAVSSSIDIAKFGVFRTFGAFSANNGSTGLEPWVTNFSGTTAHYLLDIAPGNADSSPDAFVGSDDKLFFTAAEPTNGKELWVHETVANATHLVENIRPGNNTSDPKFFQELDGRLYFVADDGTHGAELWVSDGTEAGTFMVEEIGAGATGAAIQALWVAGRRVYFARFGAITGEIWQTDGTEAGTLLVEVVNLTGVPVDAGERLFFRSFDNVAGNEPWVMDLVDQQHGPVCDRRKTFIPDDDPGLVARQLHLASQEEILDLDVVVDLAHTYVGDLTITLTHFETATSVVLVNTMPNGGGGCAGDDLDFTFDDEAAAKPDLSCTSGDPALPRYSRFKPAALLSAFDGQTAAGSWSLQITDNVLQDRGTLHSWCLDIHTALIADDGFESGTFGGWSAATP